MQRSSQDDCELGAHIQTFRWLTSPIDKTVWWDVISSVSTRRTGNSLPKDGPQTSRQEASRRFDSFLPFQESSTVHLP